VAKKAVKPADADDTGRAPEERASATPAQTPNNESPTARRPGGWRDHQPVHPAAEIFPQMNEDDLRALGESIKDQGLLNRIVLWEDGGPLLIDGRNRLDALELLGLLKWNEEHSRLEYRFTDGEFRDVPRTHCRKDQDPYELALALNSKRRHLTNEQKREVAGRLLLRFSDRSNLAIAKMIGIDDKTVASVRQEMERRSEIRTSETRADSKGREQPAHKPPPPSRPDPARPHVDKQYAPKPKRASPLDKVNEYVASAESYQRSRGKKVDESDAVAAVIAMCGPEELQAIIDSPRFGGAYKTAAANRLAPPRIVGGPVIAHYTKRFREMIALARTELAADEMPTLFMALRDALEDVSGGAP